MHFMPFFSLGPAHNCQCKMCSYHAIIIFLFDHLIVEIMWYCGVIAIIIHYQVS